MARVMLLALSLYDRSSLFHSTEALVDQFHTSPMKTEFSALLSHYRSSLSSLSGVIHILKLILLYTSVAKTSPLASPPSSHLPLHANLIIQI